MAFDDLKSRRRFRPTIGATIAALTGVAVLISLGTWQLQRREWKLDLIERFSERIAASPAPLQEALSGREDGGDIQFKKVTLTGKYDHDGEAHVAGTLNGAAGYYIFTPLVTDRSVIYINRGFARASDKAATRRPNLPTETVSITGLFREAEIKTGLAAALAPPNDPDGNVWYERNPTAFSAAYGITAEPFYLESNGAEAPADILKQAPTKARYSNRHLEYALTWYGLALTLIGVWGAYSYKKPD
ncbi:MAG: SURF1 family protein [Pseudomonadota bacterium]